MTDPAPPTAPPTESTGVVLRAERRRFEADRLTKLLLFLSFISLVVLAGLAVLIQKSSQNNDDTGEAVERMETSIERMEASVHRVEEFVDELENLTPEEQTQNEAIVIAVQQVPEILAVLCEVFPEATACQGG